MIVSGDPILSLSQFMSYMITFNHFFSRKVSSSQLRDDKLKRVADRLSKQQPRKSSENEKQQQQLTQNNNEKVSSK